MRILYIEDVPDWEFMKAIFRKTIFNMNIGRDLISKLDYEAKSTERWDYLHKKLKIKLLRILIIICISHHFEDAMYYVTAMSDTFDLFIVDRNLKYLDGSVNFEN